MKRILLLFVAIAAVAFTGCSKDDDSAFKYGDAIYGKWEGIAIKNKGEWVDITKYPNTNLAFSATFNSDGTYSGDGYFGKGSGTFDATDDMVITYIDGKEYARYKISSISGNVAEMTMSMGNSSVDIRCEKQ